MKKKVPQKLTDEELLSALDDKTPNEKPPDHSVIKFLADFSIYPGTNEVDGAILYKLYKLHVDEYVPAEQFHLILRSYVEYRVYRNTYIYSLNQEPFTFTKKLAEYLAKAKKKQVLNSRWYRHHYEKFIVDLKLKPGKRAIPAIALYFFYDRWQYKNTKTRLAYPAFQSMSKLYFKHSRGKENATVFYINSNAFSPEDLKTALEWAKKYGARKEKKKKE